MAAPSDNKRGKPSTSFGFGQSTTDAAAAATNPIKLVVYDFDQTLSSVHLYHELQGKQEAALTKLSDERLLEIFGGTKRLERLSAHLSRVSEKCELAIISFGYVGVIKAALTRMSLFKFFSDSEIIGCDSDELSEAKGNKATCIKRMRKKRKITSKQVIFVDDDMSNIVKAKSCCVTVAIQPRCGMSSAHMTSIEEQCLVCPKLAQRMEITTPKTVQKQVKKHYPEQEQKQTQQKEAPIVDGLARFRIDPKKAALLDGDMDSLVTETPVIQIGGDGTPHSDSEYELNVPLLNTELEAVINNDDDQEAEQEQEQNT